MTPKIPWDELFVAATRARSAAHAPYSNFHVGAALVTDQGRIVEGCNVENASYGLSVCAERNAIAKMVLERAGTPRAVVIVTGAEAPTPPCGMCRQVFAEFAGPTLEVHTRTLGGEEQRWTLGELLPHAFTAELLNS